MPVSPSLWEAYDIASQVLAYLHDDLAMAGAILAVEGEFANIERTYDEFPSSEPSPS